MTRPLLLVAVILAALPCAACRGGGASGSAAGTRSAGVAAASAPTPMRFRRMQSMTSRAAQIALLGDARALRAMSPQLGNEGLALIQATLPHDVARTDVPRYLEGRARFGDALKHWVTVVASGTDAQVLEAARRLDDATRGWVDAYLGREPETSV